MNLPLVLETMQAVCHVAHFRQVRTVLKQRSRTAVWIRNTGATSEQGGVTTAASGCSRFYGINAQVQDSGEQPVARRASGAVKKRRAKKSHGGVEDSMLKAETE